MSLLRNIFGTSKNEIWAQIANDIGGEFKEGGFWDRGEISYRHGEWEIKLDTYTDDNEDSYTTYTRMRAPFVNKDKFYFGIYRTGFFSKAGKFFGMQDIEIGDKFFDDKFIIKSKNISKVKRLLAGDEIKTLIERQPNIHFKIEKLAGLFHSYYPEGVDALYFECDGELNDEQKIKDLFDLFSFTLERLVNIDSAYAHNPNSKFV